MTEHTDLAATTIRAKASRDAADLIGPGGVDVPADSVQAQRAVEAQDRIDLIIRRESELAVFDLEAVRELGKYAN